MALSAKMEGLRLVGFGLVPFEDPKLGVAAVNYEPAHRCCALLATDFAFVDSADQEAS
jgi:hypothetical protein